MFYVGQQESKQSRSPGISESANTGSQQISLVYRDKQEAWVWQELTKVEDWKRSQQGSEHSLWWPRLQTEGKLRGHLLL